MVTRFNVPGHIFQACVDLVAYKGGKECDKFWNADRKHRPKTGSPTSANETLACLRVIHWILSRYISETYHTIDIRSIIKVD